MPLVIIIVGILFMFFTLNGLMTFFNDLGREGKHIIYNIQGKQIGKHVKEEDNAERECREIN